MKRRGYLLFIALVIAGGSAWAQPSVTTDSVNLFAVDTAPKKSSILAMTATLVLPGSGHQYLGRDRSALIYLSADATSLFAYLFCTLYANKIAQNAAGYAWIHSGASGPIKDADDDYWRKVGDYIDVEAYNNVVDLNRGSDKDKITDENRFWHWDDKSSQDRFNAIRKTSRSYRIISSFFIGAMALNRVVAFIDVRFFTRNHTVSQNSLNISPRLDPVSGASGILLSGSF